MTGVQIQTQMCLTFEGDIEVVMVKKYIIIGISQASF